MPQERLDRVRALLPERGVDALLVTRYENRRWLSGVTARDASPVSLAGWLIVAPERAVFVTSFNYRGAAMAEADGVEVADTPRDKRVHQVVAEQVKALGIRRLGFEAAGLAVKARDDLAAGLAGAAELAALESFVDPLRAVKEIAEIAAIRRAVALSDAAMEAFYAEVKPGMTEAEAAWFIEAHMRTHGAEGMAFEPGVAAGPNAAIPHHKPTDRPIRAHEPIWVDIGALVSGYCSDITRTVCLGEPDQQYRRLWHEVLECQNRTLDFVRPGRLGKPCDDFARAYLTSVGLGEAFGHGLGHGVGLEIHEQPMLTSYASDVPLAAGMVVTVEPGAYIDGWGGVRHEELVVLSDSGVEVMTKAAKPYTL